MVRNIAERIREIKKRYNLSSFFEIKWTKVSPAKSRFYLDLLDYFLDDANLHFRGLVVSDKSILHHEVFGQTHDEWCYKMYFEMLKAILSPKERYRIYLDMKDSRSANKVAKLYEVLCNNMYEYSRDIIERVQTVRSHEVELIQLCDLLLGGLAYANRGLTSNTAKVAFIERMRKRSGYVLNRTTLMRESKLNLLMWNPRISNER
jgi:hypothetical protein